MRCITRIINDNLNTGKHAGVLSLFDRYHDEKTYWLGQFARKENRVYIKDSRTVRDRAVKAKYKPLSGLQDRMWKLALTDASETWVKYYESLLEPIRKRVFKREDFTLDMKHYANWILCGYLQLFDCLDGKRPVSYTNKKNETIRKNVKLSESKTIKVNRFIRRCVKQHKGHYPSVKLSRSFTLDSNCYQTFGKNNTQYLSIMSLIPRKRIVLPLLGKTLIKGNLRIVKNQKRLEVHFGKALPHEEIKSSKVLAVDMGYTEAYTDQNGERYGIELGEILNDHTNDRFTKGKIRNKFYAQVKALSQSSNKKDRIKARHIKRFNLGKEKLNKRATKRKTHIKNIVNQGLNALIKKEQPEVLIVELLNQFKFDSYPSVNRRLSDWTRGVIDKRVIFKAKAKGFCLKQVNAAYSSQLCPCCDFVDSKNRQGDKFKCLECKFEDKADRVAAYNLFIRWLDNDIPLYMPYKEVKLHLMNKRAKKLATPIGNKACQSLAYLAKTPFVTVPGKTLDTIKENPQSLNKRIAKRLGKLIPEFGLLA